MFRARLCLASLLAAISLSCGGDSAGPSSDVASVSINPASATLGLNATLQLTAIVRDVSGNGLSGRSVTWSSGNQAIVTVSSDGLVTAKALGSTAVTATSEGKSGNATIVVATPVASVRVTPAADTMFIGGTLDLSATAYDAQGAPLSGRVVSWTSSAPAVAQVTGTTSLGHVSANSAGAAMITAAIEGVKDSARLAIRQLDLNGVWDYTEIIGSGAFACSDTGSYRFIQAANTFTGLTQQVGICGSNDNADSEAVSLGITHGGLITFSVGSCDYTGTVDKSQHGVTGTLSCSGETGSWQAVQGGPLAGLVLAPTDLELVRGGSSPLVAQLSDTIGNRVFFRPVSWSSDNGAAAAVDANGIVSGAGTGSATITASAEGLSDGASVNVAIVAFTRVVPGTGHTCGLTAAGAAYCWGFNGGGQGGHGTRFTPQYAPLGVGGGHTWSEVRAGEDHSCGVAVGGAGYCWGLDGDGRAGDGTMTNILLQPTPVSGGLAFTTIRPGWLHSCGLAGGTVYCWGVNNDGSLGTGDQINSLIPVASSGGLVFSQVAVGTGFSTTSCALTASGAAYCWGRNDAGQVGTGSNAQYAILSPSPVVGGHTFTQVVIGQLHGCGLTAAGAAYCWGSNLTGQFGDGTTTDHLTPSIAAKGMTFVAIGAGNLFTCGLTGGGAAYCWGANEYGQLGRGPIGGDPLADSLIVPRPVVGGHTFASIDVGGFHVCGITTGGDTYCWGVNIDGQLGDGTRTDNGTPLLVLGQAASAPVAPNGVPAAVRSAGGKLGSLSTTNRITRKR